MTPPMFQQMTQEVQEIMILKDNTLLPRADYELQEKLIHQDYKLLEFADDYVKVLVIKSILRNIDYLAALEIEDVWNESLR